MSGQEAQEINERAHEACVSMQTRPTGTNKTQNLEIWQLELESKKYLPFVIYSCGEVLNR